jgi:hypothetical protein
MFYWLQQTEQGQEAIDFILASTPRAKKRVRRVQFLSEEDNKILEASLRTKSNKVQRRSRLNVVLSEEINHRSNLDDATTSDIAPSGKKSARFSNTISSTWNEKSLTLLRNAMNADTDESNSKSADRMISETTTPFMNLPLASKLRNDAFAGNDSSKTPKTLLDTDGTSKKPMISTAATVSIDVNESSIDLFDAMDDFSLTRSGKIARSARDSLLLLRIDPNLQPDDDPRMELIQPSSLDECPSDEQQPCSDHDTDAHSDVADDATENVVAIPTYRIPSDSIKDMGKNTSTPTSRAAPSPTSRPLGLSNRAF